MTVYDEEIETGRNDNKYMYTKAEAVYKADRVVEFVWHPFVLVTLDLLDKGVFCFLTRLPAVCKELYEIVKGCKFGDKDNILNMKDDNDFYFHECHSVLYKNERL